MAGSDEFDPNARCLSGGMPNMMGITVAWKFNTMKTRSPSTASCTTCIAGFLEHAAVSESSTIRRSPGIPRGIGKGTRLLVDTVAIREKTCCSRMFSPHSDQFTVRERIRFTSPGVLEDRITVTDPKALLEPFTSVRTYRKVSPPNDELREFSCAEGLASAKSGLETCGRGRWPFAVHEFDIARTRSRRLAAPGVNPADSSFLRASSCRVMRSASQRLRHLCSVGSPAHLGEATAVWRGLRSG